MKRLIFVLLLIGLLFAASLTPFVAQADDPMVGEIRLWAGDVNDTPDGWLPCQGQGLNSTTYSELYDVLGTMYGSAAGNVYLPNLIGRVPVGQNRLDPYGPFYGYGQTGGEISHTLTIAEMPSHRHETDRGVTLGASWSNGAAYFALAPNLGAVAGALGTTYAGGGGAHNNLQPYLVLNYIIFTGVYLNPTPTPTPTATPTATITPTATTTASTMYLPYTSFYTTTLQSGNTLTVPVYVNLGQYITGGVILSLLTVYAFYFLFRMVYRR